ncbi:unnamed protein product [Pleuronectes platessa]|uniref:Uncharacterized protein n=1 Tax=Pleuronectes platessa TaxID=8262 RepID=A0A9N7UB27_PLEPL|nr:unnamed protein product [Pleuronectes platessa]
MKLSHCCFLQHFPSSDDTVVRSCHRLSEHHVTSLQPRTEGSFVSHPLTTDLPLEELLLLHHNLPPPPCCACIVCSARRSSACVNPDGCKLNNTWLLRGRAAARRSRTFLLDPCDSATRTEMWILVELVPGPGVYLSDVEPGCVTPPNRTRLKLHQLKTPNQCDQGSCDQQGPLICGNPDPTTAVHPSP